jgi:hypothetical protein
MIVSQTDRSPLARPNSIFGWIERVWLLGVMATALVLALVNLPYMPRTWFDEGSHLHVPKTLIQYGVYADISAEGFRYYGPTVGVGPTVMLPIALVFNVFGIGLVQGRVVIVAYLLLALISYLALGRRLYGSTVTLLGATFLLASRTLGREGLVEYGRQVLGEVPGLAFLLLGALAWVIALQTIGDRGRWRHRHTLFGALAGLGFGLALVTKNQFALIMPPTLVVVALLDWIYYRAGTWRLRLIPPVVAVACFGIWMLAQLLFLGPGNFVENLELTRRAAGGAIFVFDIHATLRAGVYLLRPDLYGGLLIPALAFAVYRARRRDAHGLAEALIVTLVIVWLAWYVGASLGWPRYAFPAVAFGALLVARMVTELVGWLWQGGTTLKRSLAYGVVIYCAIAIAIPLGITTRNLFTPDTTAQQFAAYLKAVVPQDTLVETWEPELGVLTEHRYHYPPIELLDKAVRHTWLGGPPIVYDGLSAAPPYVAIGNLGDVTGIYYLSGDLDRYYVQVYQSGSYTLYKRKP